MGGRGGSSHCGGGGGFGRGHLAEWTDNESALRQIMRDTGLPEAAARQVQQDMIRYFGADYGSFTNGSLPVETQRITDALLKMPYYNAGPIYRGIHVPNAVADRFLQDYQVGTRHSFGILQSFSSREDVAESFGVWNAVYGHTTSIKFVLQGNKTAPSTVHISHFGYSESEVLSPHIQEFEVLRAEVEAGAQGHRRITFYLEDRTRRKGRKSK